MKESTFRYATLAVLVALHAFACASGSPAPPEHAATAPDQVVAVHAAAAAPKCAIRGPLPDPACTPGAIETTDLSVICGQSTKARRDVASAVHRAAFEEYGLPYPPARDAYEVDHLISLELGGDNSLANLWPEAAAPLPGFHQKDAVENYLHREVCAGRMKLEDAQHAIATDWLAVYGRMAKDAGSR